MPLTEAACRTAIPESKAHKMSDGLGLYLVVHPSGAKKWVHRYRLAGATRDDTIGTYPKMTLAAARLARSAARALLAEGVDPREPNPRAAADEPAPARRFDAVAEAWFDARKRPTLDERTATRQWSRIANLFPALGDKDIGEIGPADVLAALRSIEERGAVYTARRVRGMAEALFAYARIPYSLTGVNPASTELLHSLRPAPVARNQPAMPFDALPMFYAKLRGERCLQAQDDTRTRLAIELILHTLLRTHELRHALWTDRHGDELHIPAERMKVVNGVARDHIAPLTTRAQEILRELKPFARGSAMIFPGLRPGRPMSENTMGNWMKARGYQDEATIHGFRTTASTHLHESGLWDSRWIEVQLAHVDRNKTRGVYNKAIYLEQRKKMMAWWGDELARHEALGALL